MALFRLGTDSTKALILWHPSSNVYLLQEVDSESRRAFYVNELELFTSGFANFYYSFAPNYDVWFVPYPLTRPIGRVRSGLLSFGAYRPREQHEFSCQVPFVGRFPRSSWIVPYWFGDFRMRAGNLGLSSIFISRLGTPAVACDDRN
jgi:hypothetical protein